MNLDDLSQIETDAGGHTDKREEKEKSSNSTSSCDCATGGESEEEARPETPPRDRDVNFRHAIRTALPNVGGIQHCLDQYLSMDYENID